MPLDPTKPLWLPEGTVRAILTMMLVLAVVVLAAFQVGIPEVLSTLAGIALRDYFSTRQEAK